MDYKKVFDSMRLSTTKNAYIQRKQIGCYGTREDELSRLVVPLYDENGHIVNLQTITGDGVKLFQKGAQVTGAFFCIGVNAGKILICEGFATGASLYEHTGIRTIVAFNAGNLMPVGRVIRKILPYSQIIFCADNDLNGIGIKKASEAAHVVGGLVCMSPVPDTDFNDYALTDNRFKIPLIVNDAKEPESLSLEFKAKFKLNLI